MKNYTTNGSCEHPFSYIIFTPAENLNSFLKELVNDTAGTFVNLNMWRRVGGEIPIPPSYFK